MFHPRRQAAGRPDWVQEIKHDGYRLIVRRDGEMVRLFTRRGYDWTDRYPAITRAAATLRGKSFTIDGEAAVCGPDGIAVFDSLHRRHKATDALLFGFDLLELDGEDLRPRPLGERKARLAKLQGDRDRVQRAHPRGRRDRVPARLQARPGRDCVEATDGALSFRTIARLDQGEESGLTSDASGASRDVVTAQSDRRLPSRALGQAKGGGVQSSPSHGCCRRLGLCGSRMGCDPKGE
jgi:hypothetical protein